MIVRFERKEKIKYGWLVDNRIRVIEGNPFSPKDGARPIMTGLEVPLEEVRLVAPCQPSKIVCVGLNYKDYAAEMKLDLPPEPLLSLKPSTSVIGPKEAIEYPSLSQSVHCEGGLAVVIKKTCQNIEPDEANDYIMGYTCAIDVTARDLQVSGGHWTRGKSFDTFCPLGPGIAPKLDVNDLSIRLRVNHEVKQNSSTKELIFNIPTLVSFVSRVMALLPGDVILIGTPPGAGPLQPGDEVSLTIEDIGTLTCPIVRSDT